MSPNPGIWDIFPITNRYHYSMKNFDCKISLTYTCYSIFANDQSFSMGKKNHLEMISQNWYLNNYFDFHVCLSFRASVHRPCIPKLAPIPAVVSQNVTNVAWYVLWVKNIHFGSPSDPSQTTAAKARLSYIYSILKPHGQSFRGQVRALLSEAKPG